MHIIIKMSARCISLCSFDRAKGSKFKKCHLFHSIWQLQNLSYENACALLSILLQYLSLIGGETSTGGGPSVGGASSMTIIELTTTTTHLHTETTTIGPSQPPNKQLPAVGGALPGGGVASGQPAVGGAMPGGGMALTSGQQSGIGVGQRSTGAGSLQSQKKTLIQYRMYSKTLDA